MYLIRGYWPDGSVIESRCDDRADAIERAAWYAGIGTIMFAAVERNGVTIYHSAAAES